MIAQKRVYTESVFSENKKYHFICVPFENIVVNFAENTVKLNLLLEMCKW